MSRLAVSTARVATAALLLGLSVAGCTSSPDEPDPSAGSTASTSSATSGRSPTSALSTTTLAGDRCVASAVDASVGRIADPALDEISGAAASPTDGEIVWVHEDSGNPAVITAVALDGTTVSSWTVSDTVAIDWEDMSAATSPSGEPTIFLADIGDNRAARDHVNVLVVPEPEPRAGGGTVAPVRTLRLELPEPADAEALLIDPSTGDLVLLTKELTGEASVFVAAGAAWSDGAAPPRLEHAGTLPLGLLSAVLAGDVAADGSSIVLRTPGNLWSWTRDPGTSIADTVLGDEPCRLPSRVDPYGEAAAILADGTIWLVGEGVHPAIAVVR